MLRKYLMVAVAFWLLGLATARAAELTVASVNMIQGTTANVVVSGSISDELTFGVTIKLEITPQPGAVGTVEFTSSPPADIVQLGDPWPDEGIFSPFDTDLSFSSTLNGIVDDNGTLQPADTTFSAALASFPVAASLDAHGTWDVRLSTIEGDSSWEGVSTTLVAGTIAVCAVPDAPTQPTGEKGYTKNRYISFVPGNDGENTALRVKLTSSQQFPGVTGYWWVGPPQRVTESSGSANPPPPQPSFWAATLQCQPYYTDWPTTLHVYDEGIVPDSTYEVQAIHEDCSVNVELFYSPPLTTTTTIWGDVCGFWDGNHWAAPDGVVYVVTDVTAMMDKFSNKTGAPIKARADVDPALVNRKVMFADVIQVNSAFGGAAYPFGAPQGCP